MDKRRPRRYDPVEEYERLYEGRDITRNQLKQEDSGLYEKLRRTGKLAEVIPKSYSGGTQRPRGYDPVEVFNEEYGDMNLSRSELRRKDFSLYDKLRKAGKLDEVIPDKRKGRGIRMRPELDNPLVYFHQEFGHMRPFLTRKDLLELDGSLHRELYKRGLLDEAIPPQREKRDFGDDPLGYFNKHYRGKVKSKYELSKVDGTLYSKLRDVDLLDVAFPPQGDVLKLTDFPLLEEWVREQRPIRVPRPQPEVIEAEEEPINLEEKGSIARLLRKRFEEEEKSN